MGALSVLLALQIGIGLTQAFLLPPARPAPTPPLQRLHTSSSSLSSATPDCRSAPLATTWRRPAAVAAAAASGDGEEGEMVMEEANCPCSDMGSGTGLGQPGPLTELCDVGDVVVLVLADADAEGKTLALAVVDGDDEATLLCLRDAESSEWYRDCREGPRRGLTASVVLRVVGTAAYSQRNIPSLGGGVGYGAEAEDCFVIDESDLEGAGLDAGARAGLRRPLDNVGTAPS